ncbi:hypothetical protein Tco_1545911 [Tanacetum coccineum]
MLSTLRLHIAVQIEKARVPLIVPANAKPKQQKKKKKKSFAVRTRASSRVLALLGYLVLFSFSFVSVFLCSAYREDERILGFRSPVLHYKYLFHTRKTHIAFEIKRGGRSGSGSGGSGGGAGGGGGGGAGGGGGGQCGEGLGCRSKWRLGCAGQAWWWVSLVAVWAQELALAVGVGCGAGAVGVVQRGAIGSVRWER